MEVCPSRYFLASNITVLSSKGVGQICSVQFITEDVGSSSLKISRLWSREQKMTAKVVLWTRFAGITDKQNGFT